MSETADREPTDNFEVDLANLLGGRRVGRMNRLILFQSRLRSDDT